MPVDGQNQRIRTKSKLSQLCQWTFDIVNKWLKEASKVESALVWLDRY